MAAEATFMKGKGCGHCGRTGYRGRLGIFELMMMTAKIRELAFAGAPTQDDPQGGHSSRHDNTLQRRHPQGRCRDHDDRRGIPSRQESRALKLIAIPRAPAGIAIAIARRPQAPLTCRDLSRPKNDPDCNIVVHDHRIDLPESAVAPASSPATNLATPLRIDSAGFAAVQALDLMSCGHVRIINRPAIGDAFIS